MKVLINKDFSPTPETIEALTAWGKVKKNPKGDKLIDQEFIERPDILAEFVAYWSSEAPEKTRKKANWQTTYRNYVKLIAWPNELREFERNRHIRKEHGTGQVDFFNKSKPEQPHKPRKYRFIEHKEPTETMSMGEGLNALKQALG